MKWCTYSFINGECPQYIGKLEMDGIRGVIQYSSGRKHNEYWDMDFVRVFDNLIDAIKFMRDKSDRALCNIKDDLLCNFYDDAKQINWNIL